MNLLLITDAWEPQVNGVVRTYQNTIRELRSRGWRVDVIHPYLPYLKRRPLSGYKEIEVVTNPWAIKNKITHASYYDVPIHIATEGPLGLYARWVLRNKGFTTCYHTRFPEFLNERFNLPTWLFYPYFRWFHKKSRKVMVPTKEMEHHLASKGFKDLGVWTRGVDSSLFTPENRNGDGGYLLCVSRVSQEKGLDDFCQIDHPNKVLIGDGPYLDTLKKRYSDVKFLGKMQGLELAIWYANADCFVFPSKTDTFGIVILEALASGTPVASYPTAGAKETIEAGINGCMSDCLQEAVDVCLNISREQVYDSSKKWTWKNATNTFLNNLL